MAEALPRHLRGMRAFSSVEWLIALRYLGAQRRAGYISLISLISFLGIMLGVATLIIVMAVMNGFRSDLLARILGMSGHGVVYVVPSAADASEESRNVEALAQALAQVEGVRSATPYVEGTAMASSASHTQGVLLRAMAPAALQTLPRLQDALVAGSLDALGTQTGVVVGTRLAAAHGLEVGRRLSLMTPHGSATPFGRLPKLRSLPVLGIFDLGFLDYDNSLVVLPMQDALELLAQPAPHLIEVFLDDADLVEEAGRALEAELAGRGVFVGWQEQHAALAGALKVERNVMFLILTLILLVAALNIVSGMVMMVKDKAQEIAVLRGLGASRYAVLRIFMLDGAAVGLTGTALGLCLGLLFCRYIEPIRQMLIWLTGADLFPVEVYFLQELPADPDTGETVSVVLMALSLSLLSTIYPAWRAASLDPVEALRYE